MEMNAIEAIGKIKLMNPIFLANMIVESDMINDKPKLTVPDLNILIWSKASFTAKIRRIDGISRLYITAAP